MSQIGMQMPGGVRRRSATPDVFTGLVFCAVVFLAVASVLVTMNAVKVGKDGSPFGLQDSGPGAKISLKK